MIIRKDIAAIAMQLVQRRREQERAESVEFRRGGNVQRGNIESSSVWE